MVSSRSGPTKSVPEGREASLVVTGSLHLDGPAGRIWLGSHENQTAVNLPGWSAGWGLWWSPWRKPVLRLLEEMPRQTRWDVLIAIKGRIVASVRRQDGRNHLQLEPGRFFSAERVTPS